MSPTSETVGRRPGGLRAALRGLGYEAGRAAVSTKHREGGVQVTPRPAPNTVEPQKESAAAAFANAILDNWDKFDRGGDGYVSRQDAVDAANDPSVTDTASAAASALLDHLPQKAGKTRRQLRKNRRSRRQERRKARRRRRRGKDPAESTGGDMLLSEANNDERGLETSGVTKADLERLAAATPISGPLSRLQETLSSDFALNNQTIQTRRAWNNKTMAEALMVISGTAAAADKAVVVTELLKMPQAALEVLRDEGAKVWVCRNSVTEVRADLQGVRPRGWPAGMTWDNVPGLFDPGGNRTIIATRGGIVPLTGDGHGSSNLVIHEVGHAVDHNSAASTSPAFVASREADKAGLSAYESQAGDAGKEETYAESMGRYYGGDANDRANHPNLNEYWKNNPVEGQIFAEIREAAKTGGTAAYVKTTVKKRHLARANATERAGMIINLLAAAPDTAKILEILKAGNANATMNAIVAAGKRGEFFAAHAGAALQTLYTVAAVEIQKHKADAAGGR